MPWQWLQLAVRTQELSLELEFELTRRGGNSVTKTYLIENVWLQQVVVKLAPPLIIFRQCIFTQCLRGVSVFALGLSELATL
ncbi:hypothetical protein GJAV_G00064430 [Gymnothorax javanicus]|nr:hypothetical protein GJAV_G00064430 [Gymnothorax javanicus]